MQIRSPHVFLSHDWPQSIERHGDLQALLKRKPHFNDDVKSGQLGSPPLMDIVKHVKPARWFAAHLHVRFEAEFTHGDADAGQAQAVGAGTAAVVSNPDEIEISMDDDDDEADVKRAESVAVEAPAAAEPLPQDKNNDEITLDDEEEEVKISLAPPGEPAVQNDAPPPTTRFLALDKCLPRRLYLEVCLSRPSLFLSGIH